MRYQDIPTILKETGLPVTYYAWPEDDLQHPVPDLPYIVFYYPKMRIEPADDHVAGQIAQINIELYTNEKDFETEKTVEEVLDKYSLIYSKGETYLKDESMYEVLYITEAVIDRVEVTNEN